MSKVFENNHIEKNIIVSFEKIDKYVKVAKGDPP